MGIQVSWQVAIRGIKHGALRRFFKRRDARRLNPDHARRIEAILKALDSSDPLGALAAPSYRLHRLKGDRRDEWSVRVDKGWRVTFRTDGASEWVVELRELPSLERAA